MVGLPALMVGWNVKILSNYEKKYTNTKFISIKYCLSTIQTFVIQGNYALIIFDILCAFRLKHVKYIIADKGYTSDPARNKLKTWKVDLNFATSQKPIKARVTR